MTNLLNPDPGNEQLAQDAHARGDLATALRAHEAHLAARRQSGTAEAETFLFHALLLFQDDRLPDSLAIIDEGLHLFPDAPTLHENRGVLLLTTGDNGGAMQACLRALECGSQSPNTHDCLADAAGRLGRLDLAVQYGRAALEAKDRMFSAYPALATMPTTPPPPFNPLNPAENIIAYTLWGSSDRYFVPLLENLRLIKHLFPGWSARIHLDASVPPAMRNDLAQHGAQIVEFQLPPDMPGHRRLLWRFAVLGDPTVRRYLIRDADSLLTVKERVAVDAWLASSIHFHTMRDYFTHTDLLLAGMWGGVGGILPNIDTLFANRQAWRAEGNHIDQDLLSETVWPAIRHRCLIHDSVFTGCLGSVPFPPFGALQPGCHIGENSFLRFVPNA